MTSLPAKIIHFFKCVLCGVEFFIYVEREINEIKYGKNKRKLNEESLKWKKLKF